MPNKRKPSTEQEFFLELGLAIVQWSRVEAAYCDLFQRLVLCAISGKGLGKPTSEGFFILGNIFTTTTNFRTNVDLVGHIFDTIVFDKELKGQWNSIRNKASVLYAKRNILAHGQAWTEGGDDIVSFMSYSVFSKKDMKLDFQQIIEAKESFFSYAQKVNQLAIDVSAHLAKR